MAKGNGYLGVNHLERLTASKQVGNNGKNPPTINPWPGLSKVMMRSHQNPHHFLSYYLKP
jgi:hypothetical protein